MPEFKIGDIVVLTAGSMRMAVEGIKKDKVSTVWCNEGSIVRGNIRRRKGLSRQDIMV